MAKKKLLCFIVALLLLQIDNSYAQCDPGNKQLYIMVSRSMPDEVIKKIIFDAKQYEGSVVLRGFIDDNFQKTVSYFVNLTNSQAESVFIDPELFNKFNIYSVPTIVVSDGDKFDKLSGNVPLNYAINYFKEHGELNYCDW